MKAIDRLFEYFEYKKIKPTRLEKDMGFSNGYFGIQKKRGASIGSEILESIVNNCRDLNIEWLVTGHGDMILPEKKQDIGCQVKNCDFMDMIDRKDKRIYEMAEEIGKLKQEVFSLKKGSNLSAYNLAAEP